MTFPKTICERLKYMLERHGCEAYSGSPTGYQAFRNKLVPTMGQNIYLGPKGSLRTGNTINNAIPSPVLRARLLGEFSVICRRSRMKLVEPTTTKGTANA